MLEKVRCRNIECGEKVNKKFPRCPKCGSVIQRLLLLGSEVYVCVETESIPKEALARFTVMQGQRAVFVKDYSVVDALESGIYQLTERKGLLGFFGLSQAMKGQCLLYDAGEFHVRVPIGVVVNELHELLLNAIWGETPGAFGTPPWESSEGIRGTAVLDLALKIEDPLKLRANLAKYEIALTPKGIAFGLMEEIREVTAGEFLARSIHDIMGDNSEFKEQLRKQMQMNMRDTLHNKGLEIVRVVSLNLSCKNYEKIRGKEGAVDVDRKLWESERAGKELDLEKTGFGEEIDHKKRTLHKEIEHEETLRTHELGVEEVQSEEALKAAKAQAALEELQRQQAQKQKEGEFGRAQKLEQTDSDIAIDRKKTDHALDANQKKAEQALSLAQKARDVERDADSKDRQVKIELDVHERKSNLELESQERMAQLEAWQKAEEIKANNRQIEADMAFKAQEMQHRHQLEMAKQKLDMLQAGVSEEALLIQAMSEHPELQAAYIAAMQAKGHQQQMAIQEHYHQQILQQSQQHQQILGDLASRQISSGANPRAPLLPDGEQAACGTCGRIVQARFPKCPYCGNNLR